MGSENQNKLFTIKATLDTTAPGDLLKLETDNLGNVSLGYGVGNWYLYNGKRDEALKIFRQINIGNQWSSFGFIAAESELRR